MNAQDQDHARQSAAANLEHIDSMIQRIAHVSNCLWEGDGDDCDLSDQDIIDAIEELDRERYHDEDDSWANIQEYPLSICVRSGWTPVGQKLEAAEYEILLSTGGPATRIVGNLNQYDEPSSATLEYQDWGTPWTYYAMSGTDRGENLKYFAAHFLYSA